MADKPPNDGIWLRVLQVALMPLAVALVGWWVQDALQKDALKVERLKLAVGILISESADESVREYAVDLLESSSPEGVELPNGLRDRLFAVSLDYRRPLPLR